MRFTECLLDLITISISNYLDQCHEIVKSRRLSLQLIFRHGDVNSFPWNGTGKNACIQPTKSKEVNKWIFNQIWTMLNTKKKWFDAILFSRLFLSFYFIAWNSIADVGNTIIYIWFIAVIFVENEHFHPNNRILLSKVLLLLPCGFFYCYFLLIVYRHRLDYSYSSDDIWNRLKIMHNNYPFYVVNVYLWVFNI